MPNRLYFLPLLFALSAHVSAAEDNLALVIEGADQQLANNLKAHFGSLPQNDDERASFLFSLEKKSQHAFESLGYYQARILQSVNKDQPVWQLTLTVIPGERVKIRRIDIQILGDGVEDPAFNEYLDQAQLQPDRPLHHGDYETFKSDFQSMGLARGYFDGSFARSDIEVNRDTNVADIHFIYDAGERYTLGEVTFEGTQINLDVLETLIPFEPGTPYNTKDISTLNRNLLETGYFSNIKVIPQVDAAVDKQVPVKVEVFPRPKHGIEVGAGISTDTGPRVRLAWRTPVINRFGHHQETSIEYSERPRFAHVYTIPLSHALDDQLRLSAELIRNKYGLIQTQDEATGEFSGGKQLESDLYRLRAARQKRWANNWIFSYSLTALREHYVQEGENFAPLFAMPGVSLSQTRRGDASLDPKSGYRQSYSADFAEPSLGSEVRLTRLYAGYKFIETFFDKHRFVARADIGANLINDDDIPLTAPSLRFFAGGDNSIRGFNLNELGPRVDNVDELGNPTKETIGGRYLLVGSVEYQYYWTQQWRSALFVDSGNAFNSRQFTPVTSVGAGIHWITPIGPIKLDLGVAVKGVEDRKNRPWRLHISIGSEL
ncbi:autotransporter assembly complex protein TamA [Paraferrimonas sedimenticola]|uniref:Translocation and assembly module subunit TamA n=1 Tax=Paraferrimonas sedimenticola TaxID=375674 RepID=A0AA37RXK0_9GAMM|nr:autotransporter assembly complex family protein [Paraferrimonas sedimenticola]GLP96467.1 outer membrane protein assembly factor [Paraferrimonas sedimenticola]